MENSAGNSAGNSAENSAENSAANSAANAAADSAANLGLHGANMGPIWAHMGPYGAHMGPYGPLNMGPYGPIQPMWAHMREWPVYGDGPSVTLSLYLMLQSDVCVFLFWFPCFGTIIRQALWASRYVEYSVFSAIVPYFLKIVFHTLSPGLSKGR